MPEKPIKVTRATDYAGSYIVYTYADGHIETDPPGRPKSKEDVQRARKIEVSQTRAAAILATERGKFGLSGSQLPASVLRENANIVSGSLILRPYNSQVQKLANWAQTSTAAAGLVESLLSVVPLGGPIVEGGVGQDFVQGILAAPVAPTENLSLSFPTEV